MISQTKTYHKSHNSHSISIDSCKKSKQSQNYCCRRKAQETSSQVKEEYKLNNQQNTNLYQPCTFPLHDCKYIEHYMGRMKEELSEEKMKRRLLKRRNNQLVKQNRMFNQYFQVFQQKYSNLLQRFQNPQKETTKLGKSRDKRHDCCKAQLNTGWRLGEYYKKKRIETDNIYEYGGPFQSLTPKHDKQHHSYVTTASSRNYSRQQLPLSKFEMMYSRRS